MTAPWMEDLRVLVCMLRGDRGGAERYLRVRQRPADELLAFAARHRLSVPLLGALDGAPLRNVFSMDRLAELEDRRAQRLERSRALLTELERLAEQFNQAGQRFILLKGHYLAARFYGDPHGRDFLDLDLLVPSRDRGRAFRLLADVGYAEKSRAMFGRRITCFFVHGFDFIGRAKVDLHWNLSRHLSFRIDEAALWSSRQSYTLAGRPYDVLSGEYEVLLAVLAMLRDAERGRWKVKNVVDLIRILDVVDVERNWPAFFAARAREGTLGPAVNILAACLDVAGAGELFPHLSSALARHARRRVPVRYTADPLCLAPRRFGLGNKLWSARVHDTSLPAWGLWWGVSLPFRIAVRNRQAKPPAAQRSGSCSEHPLPSFRRKPESR